MVGPRIFRDLQTTLYAIVVGPTKELDETAFHANWFVPKSPCFYILWGQTFRHAMSVVDGESIYDWTDKFSKIIKFFYNNFVSV